MSVAVFIGLVNHHALGEKTRKRFRNATVTGFLHGAGKKPRIEQMQNRMFDATDILIHRQPVIDHRGIGRVFFVPRIGETGEVPRGIDKGVHGIGFTPRRFLAVRTGDMFPMRMMIKRIAGAIE